jgi:ClpX C4-type zinc finger
MPITPPPPVLASSRVLAYAVTDDTVEYTGQKPLIVAGQKLGAVPTLAVGRALAGGEILLLHCDADWDVLATVGYDSVDDAKRGAEQAYSGLAAKWREVSFTDAEVEAFLDNEDRGLICSFCGRHPHEVERIITGHRGAAICEICIRALREKA